jgi:DNA-binding XRE family transcriptional regulator
MEYKTIWQMLRKQYSTRSQSDVAKELGITRQTLNKYEIGYICKKTCNIKTMPFKYQPIYLRMRGLPIDLENAKYLEERFNRKRGN